VSWAGDLEEDPGDEELLRSAATDGRALVTLDKDFGELAIVRGVAHSGVIRLVGFAAREQGPMIVAALTRYADQLEAGAIVTVELGRVRVRPADRTH
jgi:predicted nuclease of predicted toxin-antitoxin system